MENINHINGSVMQHMMVMKYIVMKNVLQRQERRMIQVWKEEEKNIIEEAEVIAKKDYMSCWLNLGLQGLLPLYLIPLQANEPLKVVLEFESKRNNKGKVTKQRH